MTGPGRPTTGVRVDIRIPAHTLAELDYEAKRLGVTRAEWIRQVITDRSTAYRLIHD